MAQTVTDSCPCSCSAGEAPAVLGKLLPPPAHPYCSVRGWLHSIEAVGDPFPRAGGGDDSPGVGQGGNALLPCRLRVGSGAAPHDSHAWLPASRVPLLHFEKGAHFEISQGSQDPVGSKVH